ncbi:hypothetical protein AB0C76_39665 [Kitasatospora sp. NPDC048722]|uniref:hypothetical protein n=1 Tax=Kitasatospora sp. NPDC048722 TaxID=3155639 RepID=UPI0033C58D28
MSTPHPDAAPTPGADQTVRLGPGTGEGEETSRRDAEATVRLDSVPAPRTDRTVRLSRPPLGGPDAVETVRLDKEERGRPTGESGTVPLPRPPLGVPDPRADRTVRLSPAGPGTPDAEATVRLDSAEAESATFLDPRVWGGAPRPGESATLPEPLPASEVEEEAEPAPTPEASTSAAAPDERPLAPGELRRFGPGVPPQAAAAWHGGTTADRQPERPRRVRRWLVPVAVLLAVLALLFWRFHTTALAVTSVGVTTDPAGPGCGGTAVVTASVETNGGAGSIRYRWQRSDGTTSDELVQDVRSGTRHTDLVLRWTFDGQGSLQATATLEILSPTARTATATFPYHCS